MKQFILLLMAGLVLASCGSTRKITTSHKQRADSSALQQSTTSKDSTGTSQAATEHTKTTITKIDTTVRIKADSLEGTVRIDPKDSTVQADTIESGGMAIHTRYDPTTGKLSVKAMSKPKDVPVQAETTTTERTASTASQTATVSAQNEQKTKITTSSEQKDRTSSVTKKPGWLEALWPWWLIALVLLILYLAYRYRPTITNTYAAVRRRLRI